MADEDEGLVTIREYSVPMEADWAQNILAAAGICCLIPDRNANSLVPFPSPVRVQVPASKAEDAEEILSAMEMHRKPTREAGTRGDDEGQDSLAGEGGDQEPDSVDAIDPHDLCPVPGSAPRCPACGGEEVEATTAPAGVQESFFESLVSAATGRGWVRCAACGSVWEG
ncbi:MAG: hypothetical protein B7X11_05725 [Acidobacteria bacterium 37-65-4]|nr:MAG: hypothetical protein B7X11_05725 [Acidobacteria bacterium 37-65-4]